MSASYQVRAYTPEFAGLLTYRQRQGRFELATYDTDAAELGGRFSLRDEDGSKLIDFELENLN